MARKENGNKKIMLGGGHHLMIAGRVGTVNSRTVKTKNGETSVLDISLADSAVHDTEADPWYRVELWGKYAEAMAPHIKVGDPLSAEGELEVYIDTYTSKDGKKKQAVRKDLVHASLTLLSSKKKGELSNDDSSEEEDVEEGDEELPFN